MDELALPDLPTPDMSELSESWQGELCHKGKSIASVSVLGGIKLPVDMPKELEVHQKVKFTEFTSKVLAVDTTLTFSEITYVEEHGLMVSLFKPTSESTVMNNFLTFLNKSKSVAVSVIEENNSVVFFIPSKLAPAGMFPNIPESTEPSQKDVMFGVFKLGPKYMPIKEETEENNKDKEQTDETTVNKPENHPNEKPPQEPAELAKEQIHRQDSSETMRKQKGVLKSGPSATKQVSNEPVEPNKALTNGQPASKGGLETQSSKPAQKKLSLGEYRTRKRLNKQKPEVVFHDNPSSPPASEINTDGDILEKDAIGSKESTKYSNKDKSKSSKDINKAPEKKATKALHTDSTDKSNKQPNGDLDKIPLKEDNVVTKKHKSKSKKVEIDEEMPVLEKVSPLKQTSKRSSKRQSRDIGDVNKTTKDVTKDTTTKEKNKRLPSNSKTVTEARSNEDKQSDKTSSVTTKEHSMALSQQNSIESNGPDQSGNTALMREPEPVTQLPETASEIQNTNIANDSPNETAEMAEQKGTNNDQTINENSVVGSVTEMPSEMDIEHTDVKQEALDNQNIQPLSNPSHETIQQTDQGPTETDKPPNIPLMAEDLSVGEANSRLYPQTITVAPLEEPEHNTCELPNLDQTTIQCKKEPIFQQSQPDPIVQNSGIVNQIMPSTDALQQNINAASIQSTNASVQDVQCIPLQQTNINSQPTASFGQNPNSVSPPVLPYIAILTGDTQNIHVPHNTVHINAIHSEAQPGGIISTQTVAVSGSNQMLTSNTTDASLSQPYLPSNVQSASMPNLLLPSNAPIASLSSQIIPSYATVASLSNHMVTSNTTVSALSNQMRPSNNSVATLPNQLLPPNVTAANTQIYTGPSVDFNTSKQLIDDVFENADSSDTEIDISIPIRKEGIEFEPSAYYDILANIDSLRASLIQMNAAAKERAKCVELIDQISEKLVVKRKHNVGVFKNAGTNTKRQAFSNVVGNSMNQNGIYPVNQSRSVYSGSTTSGAPMTTVGVNLTYSLQPTTAPFMQTLQSNRLNPPQAPQMQLCQHHQMNKQTDNFQVSDVGRGESITHVPNYRSSRDSGLGTDESSPSNHFPESPVRSYSADHTLQPQLNNMQINGIQRDSLTSGLDSSHMQPSVSQITPANAAIEQPSNRVIPFNHVSTVTNDHDNFVSPSEFMASPAKQPDPFANPNDTDLRLASHRRSRSSSSESISSIFDTSMAGKRRPSRGKRSRSRDRYISDRRPGDRTQKAYRERFSADDNDRRRRSIREKGTWLNGRMEHRRQFGGKPRFGKPFTGKGFQSRQKFDSFRKPNDWNSERRLAFGAPKRIRHDSAKDEDESKKRKRESPVTPVVNVKEIDPTAQAVKKRPLSVAAMLLQIRQEAITSNSSENTESNKEDKEEKTESKKEKKSRKKKEKKEKKRRTSPASKRKSHKHCKRSRNQSESPERRKRSRSNSSRRSDIQVIKTPTEDVEKIPLPPTTTKTGPKIMHSPLYVNIPQDRHSADKITDTSTETVKRNSRKKVEVKDGDILATAVRDGVVYRTDFGSKWDSTDEYEIDNAKKDPQNKPSVSPPRATVRNSLDRLQMDYANEEPHKTFPNANQRPHTIDLSDDLSPRQREYDVRPSNALPQRGNISPRAYTPPRDFERADRPYSPPRGDWIKRERFSSPPRRDFSPSPRRDFSPPPRRDFSPPSPRRSFSPPQRREFYGRARSPPLHERETSPWRRTSPHREFHSPPFRDNQKLPFSPPPPGGPASAANQMFKQWSDTKYISHLALVVKKMLFSTEKSLYPFINKIYACQKTIGRRLNNHSNPANDARRRLENAKNLDADEEKSLRDQVAQQGENKKKFEMYSHVFHFLKTKVDVEVLLRRKSNDEQPDRSRYLTDICDGLEGKLDVLRTCKVDLLDQLKVKQQFAEETVVNAAVDHCREMIDDIRKDIKNMRNEANR